jgi:flagellar basal-body rod protein FlgC
MEGMKGLFQGIDIATAGMRAELQRAEVISSNIGNMHVTGGKTREPYRRKSVVFEEVMTNVKGSLAKLEGGDKVASGVRIARVVDDHSAPFVSRYDPADPEANDEGVVLASNVDIFREMVDMNIVERSFEANIAAMRVYRTMLQNSVAALARS